MSLEFFLTPVITYCERHQAGLLEEPLNALTNIAFLMAAGRLCTRSHVPAADGGIRYLIGLIALIGISSMAFHSFANVLTSLGDIGFIALFILSYFGLFLYRVYAMKAWEAVILLSVFVMVGVVIHLSIQAFIGATALSFYVPPMLLLWGLGVHLRRLGNPVSRGILQCAALFTLALAFRTMDAPLCPLIPTGTHFIWHLFNAALLYKLVSLLQDYTPPEKPAKSRA